MCRDIIAEWCDFLLLGPFVNAFANPHDRQFVHRLFEYGQPFKTINLQFQNFQGNSKDLFVSHIAQSLAISLFATDFSVDGKLKYRFHEKAMNM